MWFFRSHNLQQNGYLNIYSRDFTLALSLNDDSFSLKEH